MAYINDAAFDAALSWIRTNGVRLDICSQEPASYAEATSTYSLGSKAGISITAPGDGDPDGRKVTVPEIIGGSVTGTDEATHWALTDGSSTLVMVGAMSASQIVTSGNTFGFPAFDIRFPDAATPE